MCIRDSPSPSPSPNPSPSPSPNPNPNPNPNQARGDYFLRSPDTFGNLIVERAWGHFPRTQPLLSAAIAPVFVGLHSVMVWLADRAVKKRAHHKQPAAPTTMH